MGLGRVGHEMYIEDLKRIWNDIIGPPAFEVERVSTGRTVLPKKEVIQWMSDSGVYHMTPLCWKNWLMLSDTERNIILEKAFPNEEYAS